MSDKKHALLSPSSAARWLNCNPSARLESYEPEMPASVYAAEGTEAHALAELKLSYMLGLMSPAEYETRFESFRLTSAYYTEEFNDFVNDFCNEVMSIVKEDYKDEQVEVHLEDRVEFGDIVPDGSGTSDVLIIGKNFIHCIDLKFGKGVPVTAIDNPQLRLYVLGGLKKYRLKGVFTIARMTIIQPRIPDKSTDTVSVMDLNDWAENYVKPRAELATAGLGELVPGDWCKFCKRRGKCEALANMQLDAARKEFEMVVQEDRILEPHNMTPEMLGRVMTIGPRFIDWFKAVQAFAVATMINDGTKIPGYKVVEGKSQRVMTDEAAIAEILRTAGFKDEDYLKPQTLLGITGLEKNIGKKLFNELCKNYIIKPPGKLTIATLDDNRMAIETRGKLAGQEFDYIDAEIEED